MAEDHRNREGQFEPHVSNESRVRPIRGERHDGLEDNGNGWEVAGDVVRHFAVVGCEFGEETETTRGEAVGLGGAADGDNEAPLAPRSGKELSKRR